MKADQLLETNQQTRGSLMNIIKRLKKIKKQHLYLIVSVFMNVISSLGVGMFIIGIMLNIQPLIFFSGMSTIISFGLSAYFIDKYMDEWETSLRLPPPIPRNN